MESYYNIYCVCGCLYGIATGCNTGFYYLLIIWVHGTRGYVWCLRFSFGPIRSIISISSLVFCIANIFVSTSYYLLFRPINSAIYLGVCSNCDFIVYCVSCTLLSFSLSLRLLAYRMTFVGVVSVGVFVVRRWNQLRVIRMRLAFFVLTNALAHNETDRTLCCWCRNRIKM